MLKVAVTALSLSMVSRQSPFALVHAPLQPLKSEIMPGVAMRETDESLGNCAVQVPVVQAIPAGLLLRLPAPLPAIVAVRVDRAVFAKTVTSSTCQYQSLLAL